MIDLLTEASETGSYFFVPVDREYTVTYSGTFDGATVSLEVESEDGNGNTEPITVPDSAQTAAFLGRVFVDSSLPIRAAIASAGASTSVSVVLT